MQRVLDHIADTPALVITPTHDILAWNRLAAALMLDFGEIPERERNFMRLLFTDPRMRSLYSDWEGLARSVVSYIRMEAARKPDDPRLAELVGTSRSETSSSASGGPEHTLRSNGGAPAPTTTRSSVRSRWTGIRSPPRSTPTSS